MNEIVPVDKQIAAANSASIIMGIRIVQPQADVLMIPDTTFKMGDYSCGQDNLGNRIKVIIGPYRYAARRFKKDTLDAESFNLADGASYDYNTGNWTFPYSVTPAFAEILQKKIPDNGKDLANIVGYDVLFYLPDFDRYVLYFIAKTALTMTNVFNVCRENRGKIAYLGSEKAPSKTYNWFIPTIAVAAQQPEVPFVFEEEKIDLFINPDKIDTLLLESTRPR